LGSVPDQGEYLIASGGVALPNRWKLLLWAANSRELCAQIWSASS